MHKFTLCSSAAPIVLLVACSPKPSDETIAQDIEKRVSTEPRSQQAQVKVEAKQGNVTLTGRAKTEAARQEIEKIARDEHGVTNVEDQVSVEPEECLLASMRPSACLLRRRLRHFPSQWLFPREQFSRFVQAGH